jgi:hypothetical protein
MNLIRALSFVLLLAVVSSCSSGVKYYEKQHLSSPIMQFDSDATETHFIQKCLYSREGSVGGVGSSAGGGCGCY